MEGIFRFLLGNPQLDTLIPIPHECGITGIAIRWRIPCCTMSKHVKILYHLITVKACVYLTKSANNLPKCNAFIQSCRKYRSPEWIQYITLFVQVRNMLILRDVPVTLFGAEQARNLNELSHGFVEFFKPECSLDFDYRVDAFYGKVHAT